MSKNRRKILYVITKGNFGGAQRYVFDLATSVPKEKFDVVVAFGESGTLAQKLKKEGIRTIEMTSLKRDVSPLLDLKVLFELIKIFKEEKPDIIHLNSTKIGGLGVVAGRVAGIKNIIFTAHAWAWNENRNPLSKTIIMFLQWFTVFCSHKTIAVSTNLSTQMLRLPLVSQKIKVIHNGINTFDLKDGFEARQKIGSTIQHSVWIGTVSELHKNKGLDYLIEAFSQISEEYKDCGLVIVSDGEERENITNLIAQKKLQDRVHLVGFVENAKIYMKAFDIFTLTSRTEALPYTLLEAGIAQLPVIASAVGGIPEIIDGIENGLLVSKGNVREIAEKLSFLLENEQARILYGKNLKEKVLSNFSQKEMVNETIALYN